MSPPDDGPEWVTIAEIAEKLKLSKMTLYRMIDTGELTAHKFGRQFRVKASDLLQFLEEAKIDDPR